MTFILPAIRYHRVYISKPSKARRIEVMEAKWVLNQHCCASPWQYSATPVSEDLSIGKLGNTAENRITKPHLRTCFVGSLFDG
jgi:hypothetical protein